MKYNAAEIAKLLCHQTFENSLCMVDRSYWTGYEADLLFVHRSLRLIDVEIKISRDDFKADAAKHKWWHSLKLPRAQAPDAKWRGHHWPSKIWKHYIAMPEEVWNDKLLEHCSPKTGILLVRYRKDGRAISVNSIRRCSANPDARCITPTQALDIARLASLRMLEAYHKLSVAQRAAELDAKGRT